MNFPVGVQKLILNGERTAAPCAAVFKVGRIGIEDVGRDPLVGQGLALEASVTRPDDGGTRLKLDSGGFLVLCDDGFCEAAVSVQQENETAAIEVEAVDIGRASGKRLGSAKLLVEVLGGGWIDADHPRAGK